MLKIAAKERTSFGKKLKSARRAGDLPVVLYGAKEKQSLPLFVSAKDFQKIWKEAGESTMISVETPAGVKDVLIHEVDVHPVSEEPIHVDFYVVDKTKEIKINVPINFEGIAPAVKDLGGILVKVLHELEIETLPSNIPHEVVADISQLVALDSQILVKDIKVPSSIKVVNDPEGIVASVSVAKEEVEETTPIDLSSIEVEKKGKKEEEGEVTAEGGEAKAE